METNLLLLLFLGKWVSSDFHVVSVSLYTPKIVDANKELINQYCVMLDIQDVFTISFVVCNLETFLTNEKFISLCDVCKNDTPILLLIIP